MLDLEAVATILYVFGILLAIEWVGYVGFKGGLIVGCAVLGIALYGTSLLFERFGPQVISAVLL